MDTTQSPGLASVRSSQGSLADGQSMAELLIKRVDNNLSVKILYFPSVLITDPLKVTYGEHPLCRGGTYHPRIRCLYHTLEHDQSLRLLLSSAATKVGLTSGQREYHPSVYGETLIVLTRSVKFVCRSLNGFIMALGDRTLNCEFITWVSRYSFTL